MEGLEELWSASSGDPDHSALKVSESGQGGTDAGAIARLKAQMQAEALRPLNTSSVGNEEDDERPLRMGTDVDPGGKDHDESVAVWPEEILLQVGDYLRLSVSRVLHFP